MAHPHRHRRRDRAARQGNHGLMHATLQARSSAAGAATGTPPTATRPAPAADPIRLRSRWVPRLRLSEHPLALTLLVVLAALAVAQLLTPAPARADIPIVGPVA